MGNTSKRQKGTSIIIGEVHRGVVKSTKPHYLWHFTNPPPKLKVTFS